MFRTAYEEKLESIEYRRYSRSRGGGSRKHVETQYKNKLMLCGIGASGHPSCMGPISLWCGPVLELFKWEIGDQLTLTLPRSEVDLDSDGLEVGGEVSQDSDPHLTSHCDTHIGEVNPGSYPLEFP